ncbi:class I SAM-dependent methyltransferase [Halomicrococcus sp. NG-SE-24]|uniref:class I SAM-dependent methyltransferase n=1 Tax=Halomicrococcus sp. NG-SE-24 TaxID=3436928 RepID=UPI003D98FB86
MPDPFGRAIRDFHRGEQDEPLLQRDGDLTLDHPIERFYFSSFTVDSEESEWLASRLDGPLLDMGAGAGRHSLYFQEQFETVAVEVSDHLVETMRERGVADARRGDMFALREQFGRGRFRSALAIGTQLGLAQSMQGLRKFLGDLAFVTTPGGTAVVDCYDPDHEEAEELLGYRDDPTPGLAHRVMHFEYEGDVSDVLLFRLFAPDRLREAAVGTDWTVSEVRYGDDGPHYRAALEKS